MSLEYDGWICFFYDRYHIIYRFTALNLKRSAGNLKNELKVQQISF